MRPTRGYIGWARSTGDFFPLRFTRDHGGLFLLPGEERGKSSQRQVANGCSVYYEDYKTQSRNTELVEWLCCSLPQAWLAFFLHALLNNAGEESKRKLHSEEPREGVSHGEGGRLQLNSMLLNPLGVGWLAYALLLNTQLISFYLVDFGFFFLFKCGRYFKSQI